MVESPDNCSWSGPIGLGVVGVSRAWSERYRAAVERRRDRLRVVAVHDVVAARATTEASRWRASAEIGVRALMARPDVEAVLILLDPWYGDLPLQFAADEGKPVVASDASEADPDAVLDRLVAATRVSSPRDQSPP